MVCCTLLTRMEVGSIPNFFVVGSQIVNLTLGLSFSNDINNSSMRGVLTLAIVL